MRGSLLEYVSLGKQRVRFRDGPRWMPGSAWESSRATRLSNKGRVDIPGGYCQVTAAWPPSPRHSPRRITPMESLAVQARS